MVQPGLAARGAAFGREPLGPAHLVGIGLILAGVVTPNVLAGITDA
jgi:multidrug transporter EmrE-like cation transporter